MRPEQTDEAIMTTLVEQIDAMRVRMNELGTQEHGLVKTLGEALAAVDQRLLQEIRSVAAVHEARRGAILAELQMLARRMGALQGPREQVAALENSLQHERSHGTEPVPEQLSIESVLNGGADWRLAAANVRDELDSHFKVRMG